MAEIKLLSYPDINKVKWDTCIDEADNGLIYGYSFYLDAMAKNWEGLVLSTGSGSGDGYEAVMPLTWNRKYGISYLYQPPFTASLGVFGKNISAELMSHFLLAIPSKYKYWDIYFNHGNYFEVSGFELYQRMNYVLNLNQTYEKLNNNYRDNIKRNIKKSNRFQLSIKINISVDEVIKLAIESNGSTSSLKKNDYSRFETLYQHVYKSNRAKTYAVYSKDGRLLASAVFLFSHDRAFYIMVGNHPNGKTLGASHLLIDAFIKDHAGQQITLDFEGSDIPSIAFFYSGFGAVEEKYTAIHYNKLPAPVRWLKN